MIERPIGLHLETSILRQLPVEIGNADFLQLKEHCDRLGIPLFVPELCVKELVHRRQQDIQDAIAKTESGVAHIARYVESPPSVQWGAEKGEILQTAETKIRAQLAANGVTILSTPDVPLARLLDMAVRKTRPFEEKGEKGFRDSVILFTVIEYAKSQPHGYHLLVTGDAVFRHNDVKALSKAVGVKLRVADSIDNAIVDLTQFVDQAFKDYLERRAQALRSFLLANMEQIQQHVVKNAEFTSSYLTESESRWPSSLWSSAGQRVDHIDNVEVLDIVNTRPSTLPADVTEGRVEISFVARAKFSCSVMESRPSYLTRPPTLRPGEKEARQQGELAYLPPAEQITQREISKTVNVQGSVHLVEPDTYSELELKPIVGSTLGDLITGGLSFNSP